MGSECCLLRWVCHSDTARYMCDRQYGAVPEVTLLGETGLTFPYVPSHLHHMLFEVLKNSLRATVEFHGEGGAWDDTDD